MHTFEKEKDDAEIKLNKIHLTNPKQLDLSLEMILQYISNSY